VTGGETDACVRAEHPQSVGEPKGCVYGTLEFVFERCYTEMPPLFKITENHQSACWYDLAAEDNAEPGEIHFVRCLAHPVETIHFR
jgi:hypothetical protein